MNVLARARAWVCVCCENVNIIITGLGRMKTQAVLVHYYTNTHADTHAEITHRLLREIGLSTHTLYTGQSGNAAKCIYTVRMNEQAVNVPRTLNIYTNSLWCQSARDQVMIQLFLFFSLFFSFCGDRIPCTRTPDCIWRCYRIQTFVLHLNENRNSITKRYEERTKKEYRNKKNIPKQK